ncbi:hypothetical protein [Streptomyces sp. KS_5]|uniref:hypothetical protein n=1 Tax=Streptomyces sp. KS_5 TaxID=1881018 RepID=UPI00089D8AB5|nr:hypothetical protein [Streptomyces sp. KS_5]SEC34741.1 hypothetical protein SAMN05428938_1838 [Streptomyces sp. KS_5]
MQAEVSAGLIGLAGAVIGAGGALLGGWLQQRQQALTAKAERREERRYTAGQAALDMLIRFRHATASRINDDEGVDAWTEAFVEWLVTFDAALYVVPDGDEMRKRLFGIMGFIGCYEDLGHNHSEASLWIDDLCREAIGVLSAFLREEPLPEPSPFFIEMVLRFPQAPS